MHHKPQAELTGCLQATRGPHNDPPAKMRLLPPALPCTCWFFSVSSPPLSVSGDFATFSSSTGSFNYCFPKEVTHSTFWTQLMFWARQPKEGRKSKSLGLHTQLGKQIFPGVHSEELQMEVAFCIGYTLLRRGMCGGADHIARPWRMLRPPGSERVLPAALTL